MPLSSCTSEYVAPIGVVPNRVGHRGKNREGKCLKRLILLKINANLRRFTLYAVLSHMFAPLQRDVCSLLVTFSEMRAVSCSRAGILLSRASVGFPLVSRGHSLRITSLPLQG
jgi:hypothetical protein